MNGLKQHAYFLIAFSVTLSVFLYPLISMQQAFLHGDYFVQFYPWFKCYSESIKSWQFPYWVRAMQSGFPLMAEGQIGGFYPAHILLFFILPFRIAYNYSVILHFILAGIFMYLYSRRMGAGQAGGYVSALIFCFGSSYAGCFVNTAALKVLSWFPLMLLFCESYLNSRRMRFIIFSGIVAGLQLLAGAIQMAVYSTIFFLAYFLYRSISEKMPHFRIIGSAISFLVIASLLFLPQFLLTSQLAHFSSRSQASLGFALWGSFPPWGLLGLIFPYAFIFTRMHSYIGVAGVLCAISGFLYFRKQPAVKALLFLIALSVFISFGAYNPLFVAALKLSGLYMFRNPGRAVFFALFALSVFAGLGVKALSLDAQDYKNRTISLFRRLLGSAALLFLAIQVLLPLLRGSLIRFGRGYVKNFILNSAHHRYDLPYYLVKLELFYDWLARGFSFASPFNIFSLLVTAVFFFFAPFLFRRAVRPIFIALLFLELFIFSFYGIGFRVNMVPFGSGLKPGAAEILRHLQKDREYFRILPYDLKSGALPLWLQPNAQMAFGVESAACYSPLAFSHYRSALLDLEIVDDSLGLRAPAAASLADNLSLLRLLNVKYILSASALAFPFLELAAEQDNIFLYRLKGWLPRVFFAHIDGDSIKPQPAAHMRAVLYRDGFLEAEVACEVSGFLVFSENYYPGWQAYVDGKQQEIILLKGLIQAVALGKGVHRVRFEYAPFKFSRK